ncbi:hypothetical protein [Salmonella phage SP154]|nr:hypothetical protein [Salmonella phage SP154]
MNKELKLILFTLKMKIKFGNGTAENLCRSMVIDIDGDLIPQCTQISCFNCLFYQDYTYSDKVIHVWNQL